jgi:hypothetical protein
VPIRPLVGAQALLISLLLYGRNDSYGYNLHKRAALSLNCMAEMLTEDGDEILFVDYNTPDDFPTFPEAIHDTLTARVRAMLRILRVRPRQHAQFAGLTHLVALEPVARNVALRRSNPANRWVLSTNTDMIFVPRRGRSLSELAGPLSDGFYHLPRFEIPEALWESLDRSDPQGVLDEVGRWGRELHLNEVVYGLPDILFDGPGDFQLMLRADLLAIDGFDERMLLGWHVDSNIAKRLGLLRSPVSGALLDEIFGYHCDHTRQVTAAHGHGRLENDPHAFVTAVEDPRLPHQMAGWGLADELVEELRLPGRSSIYVEALREVIGEPLEHLNTLRYVAETYDRMAYDWRHVLPYLIDSLTSYSRQTRLGWFASTSDLLHRFVTIWRRLGYEQPVLCAMESWTLEPPPEGCVLVPTATIEADADVFVFDFGRPLLDEGEAAAEGVRPVATGFRDMVDAERVRLTRRSAQRRRFIAVNAVHNRFESLVARHVGVAHAPISTRLRQGFVLPSQSDGWWQFYKRLQPGEAGSWEADNTLCSRFGARGFVFFGGYVDLSPGDYRLSLRLREPPATRVEETGLRLEILSLPITLAMRQVTPQQLESGVLAIDFAVSRAIVRQLISLSIEARLWTEGRVPVVISDALLSAVQRGEVGRGAVTEWLPVMAVGSAGRPRRGGGGLVDGIEALHGTSGHVTYGPYVGLEPGAYELHTDFVVGVIGRTAEFEIVVEVVAAGSDAVLARSSIRPPITGSSLSHCLPFNVTADLLAIGVETKLEFRVHTDGAIPFVVKSVRTRLR